MSSATKDYEVFLSYVASDHSWVAAFRQSFQTESSSHWFDLSTIEPGERWADALETALRQSDTLIVFISPKSVKSPSVLFEIGAALGGKKRIIPILIGDVDDAEIPEPLTHLQMLRATTPEETGKRVAKLLETDHSHMNGN